MNYYKIGASYKWKNSTTRSYRTYEVYADSSQEAFNRVRGWIIEDLIIAVHQRLPDIRCEHIWIERDGRFESMIDMEDEE